jgi:SAM-dependent methyltransferase
VRGDRFLKIEGINYRRGAIEYPRKLDESNRYHLYTKPFYNLANKISRWSGDGLDEDTHRHFCDFANIAYVLALPAGARVLDVGCGSGWLSEYFSRLGYDCTGIDISSDLIVMANERLSSVPYGSDHQTPLKYRFLVHDIESGPLAESFDAILCYDSLHHFENEQAVVANIAAMLNYGGQLFVLEGERPPEGSSTEEELKSVMRQYETLESPFSSDYLCRLLKDHGFAIVGDYVGINRLVERSRIEGERIKFFEQLAFNYLLAKKVSRAGAQMVMPDSLNPGSLRAEFRLSGEWPSSIYEDALLQPTIEIANTGDTLWLVSQAPVKGTVRLGLKVLNEHRQTVIEVHGQPPLQRAVAPGERVTL